MIIDRNTADTQVLLLDGEQTIIGGLYSTRESISRKGIPFLKDLPGGSSGCATSSDARSARSRSRSC
ncbi:hypothetical protein [Rhodothermus marinus]|uniref:hypothetical protein n=1 Tax=Rhodothermus marinus TaxID=29549 RepID=UPI0034E23665